MQRCSLRENMKGNGKQIDEEYVNSLQEDIGKKRMGNRQNKQFARVLKDLENTQRQFTRRYKMKC